MMNKYLEINFSVDRLKVGIYYMCRRLLDKIESTETGIIVCDEFILQLVTLQGVDSQFVM